jgi:hypothetical protein
MHFSDKRDMYEKATAIVAAVRQGQLLPKKFAIRNPAAVIYTLKRDQKLSRATTESTEQYSNLVHLRVGHLVPAGAGFAEFRVIDTPENLEALEIALELVDQGAAAGVEVDDDARTAMQQKQEYVESLIAAADLRRRETIKLDPDVADELERILVGGAL